MALTKCPECGKDVSTRAPPAPASTPLPAKAQPVQRWIGYLGVLVLFLLAGWFVNLSGIFRDSGAAPSQPHSITKAEWRQKLEGRYGQYASLNIVYQWKADDFKQFMGNPSSTQNVGDEAFWYYYCSDGQIQLVMDQGNLLAWGRMVGKINDY